MINSNLQNVSTNSGYLLVVHGSRNLNYQIALQRLADLVKQELIKLDDSQLPLIETAYLELSSVSLSESITNFAFKCVAQKYNNVKVLPLFLLAGIHVTQDIPNAIKIAQEKLQDKIRIQLMPYLGNYDNLITFFEQKFCELSTEKRILIAHGSSLKKANEECKKIAFKLGAEIAFWSIKPNLQEKLATLAIDNIKSIAILPYFLFEGKITEAIALQVEELKIEYPQIKFLVGKPLGANITLANLIVSELNINC